VKRGQKAPKTLDITVKAGMTEADAQAEARAIFAGGNDVGELRVEPGASVDDWKGLATRYSEMSDAKLARDPTDYWLSDYGKMRVVMWEPLA
jgi:hypothetical protein